MEPQKPQYVFPNEIWELIFSCLGDASTQALLACRGSCRDFQYWTDTFTQLWSGMSLVRAVQDNNISLCRKIILYGHNSNPADKQGVTPLHEAAFRGQMEVCKLLIESPNVTEKNPRSGFFCVQNRKTQFWFFKTSDSKNLQTLSFGQKTQFQNL